MNAVTSCVHARMMNYALHLSSTYTVYRDYCIQWRNRVPDAIAMGVDADSMNMSDHVEFGVPQTSDVAEKMAKRLLEGIPFQDLMLDRP